MTRKLSTFLHECGLLACAESARQLEAVFEAATSLATFDALDNPDVCRRCAPDDLDGYIKARQMLDQAIKAVER